MFHQHYDSVAHAIALMVFQAFGVADGAIEAMLVAIQDMKYFLRTAYSDSKKLRVALLKFNFKDSAKEMAHGQQDGHINSGVEGRLFRVGSTDSCHDFLSLLLVEDT